MRKTILLFLSVIIFSATSFSQVYLEPFAGYQKDLNNKGVHLINTGLQLAFKKGRRYELLLQAQYSWHTLHQTTDSVFTLNTGLPLAQTAEKTVRISTASMGFGNRIQVAGYHTASKFYLVLYTGVIYQRIGIDYQYDKINYLLLNPDKTQSKASLYLSAGVDYLRQLKRGRFFAGLHIGTPPIVYRGNYPYHFHLVAPLSLNIGYSFQLSKK